MSESDLNNPIVLVVEDNEDARYFMRLALEDRGYRVCEAENGEQAIAVAGREQPNAILMDISMPVLNGLTATARIRQHYALRRTHARIQSSFMAVRLNSLALKNCSSDSTSNVLQGNNAPVKE